jgi:hypothetical protein
MNGIASQHTCNGYAEGAASRSDGMMVTELRQFRKTSNGRVPAHHCVSKAGSIPRKPVGSYVSEGYESDHSSSEDLSQVG